MTPQSTLAADGARRLWARIVAQAGGPADPAAVAAAAARLCELLGADLGRWIGTDGYRVLLERALARARTEHPALAGLACLGPSAVASTTGTLPTDAGEIEAGMVAMVAELVEMLGRIVGLEMAVRLVDQVGASNRPGAMKGST